MTEPASSLPLAPHATEAFDEVQESIPLEGAVYYIEVLGVVEEHQFCHEAFFIEDVELLLTKLPYNVCCVQQDGNSDPDRVTTNNLIDVPKFEKLY